MNTWLTLSIRLPFMQPGSRRSREKWKLPDRCFDRVAGLLLFDGTVGATSHKTRFSNTDEVLKALTSEDMSKQYASLRTQFMKKLREWHHNDSEVR